MLGTIYDRSVWPPGNALAFKTISCGCAPHNRFLSFSHVEVGAERFSREQQGLGSGVSD